MAEKDLENSVKKIEAYIEGCEKTKEQEWRTTITSKVDGLKNHLMQQDLDRKKERRIVNGKMFIAAGLPIFAIGLGMFIYGALNIDMYFEDYHFLGSPEIYMFVVGVILMWVGFRWAQDEEE